MDKPKKIVIVGGVAGGASAAARARRLCERCEIIILERGAFVSFANCGLPYYVGNVIRKEEKLLVATPELFKQRYNIEVRTGNEVTRIDRGRHEVEVKDLESGRVYRESYTSLILSPGARAIIPPLPGVDLPGVFVLRTIPDSRRIKSWIQEQKVKSAVVVGAGFIGLEMAENLSRRGLAVSIVEMAGQVMPPLDPEMAFPVQEHLKDKKVDLRLGDGLAGIKKSGKSLVVKTASGHEIRAELVLLALGVRPENTLAKDCNLELGEGGGIRVDECMRTSDPSIFAVGDAVDTTDIITGTEVLVPLAGPANRQGRIAANAIFEREARFRGVQATAVCGVYGLTVAMTGASEKSLSRAGFDGYESIYLHPGHHVGYFPGAHPIHLKLIFRRDDGRILGAQAVGEEGTARRIDVISMALQMGGTVFDLEESELCYAPQYGAAKDPVNLAGMIAANYLRGDHPVVHWRDRESAGEITLLDVRDPKEFAKGHAENAVHIPLGKLRERLDELPKGGRVWTYCATGHRSYVATRALEQHGVTVRNLSGGYQTYLAWRGANSRL